MRLGVTISEWEQMTPRELDYMLEAHREQAEDDARQDMARIYDLSAAIRAMIWNKTAPSFAELFPKARKPEMTDDEMYAEVCALNKMFGGEET